MPRLLALALNMLDNFAYILSSADFSSKIDFRANPFGTNCCEGYHQTTKKVTGR